MRQISDELVQAILNYLVTRPYNEVYKAISALRELPTMPEPGPKKDTKPKSTEGSS